MLEYVVCLSIWFLGFCCHCGPKYLYLAVECSYLHVYLVPTCLLIFRKISHLHIYSVYTFIQYHGVQVYRYRNWWHLANKSLYYFWDFVSFWSVMHVHAENLHKSAFLGRFTAHINHERKFWFYSKKKLETVSISAKYVALVTIVFPCIISEETSFTLETLKLFKEGN